MKKLAFLLTFLLFGTAIFAQSGRTRPRVAGSPPPPTTTNDSEVIYQDGANLPNGTNAPRPNPSRTPPVLHGGNSSPAATNDSSNGEVVEDSNEIIRVETNLVTVPVSVYDRSGRYVPNLRQADFSIYENGVQQKIEYFNTSESPFTVAVLIDVSNSTSFQIEEIQDAAITFIEKLRPQDRAVIISFAEEVKTLSPLTGDKRQLISAVRRTRFAGGTSLYEAVSFSMALLDREQGRKAVVLFSDGVDTTSRSARYETTLRQSQEEELTIYPILFDTYDDLNGQNAGNFPQPRRSPSGGSVLGAIIGGILGGGIQIGGNFPQSGGRNYPQGGVIGSSRADYERGRRYMNDLANRTGGRLFNADSQLGLSSAFQNVADELRQQYSIGYYPETEGRIGEQRQIKVRVNQPNLAVRSRESYVVGSNAASPTPPRRTR